MITETDRLSDQLFFLLSSLLQSMHITLILSLFLNLKSTAIIEGEVKISKLIVEAGANFNAKCSMKSSSEVKSILENREKTA